MPLLKNFPKEFMDADNLLSSTPEWWWEETITFLSWTASITAYYHQKMFRRGSQAAVTPQFLPGGRSEMLLSAKTSPDSQTRMLGYQLWRWKPGYLRSETGCGQKEADAHPLSSSFWLSHRREQAWSWADADTKESKPEGLLVKKIPGKYWPILQEPLKLQTWLQSKSCLWSTAKRGPSWSRDL